MGYALYGNMTRAIVKAMYRTTRVAEGIITIDSTSAVDQFEQVGKDLYKPVLPSSLKGLIDCPLGHKSGLFGDNLEGKQKEIVASNEAYHL